MMIGAVDVGGTKIAVGLMDEHGAILAQQSCPSAQERGFADGMSRISRMLSDCLALFPRQTLAGIGIGCTGPIDPVSGVLGPNNFLRSWEGHSIATSLEEAFGVTVATENDADAAALAETRWGAGKDAESCIYITVSTGIGGGIVNQGHLVRGVNGAHPELGHHGMDPNGPRCACGMHGCWERLAAGPALALWFAEQGGEPGADARRICELATQGEPLAQAAVERESFYLGIGLANMVTLFTPQVIVLGGGVMESWPLFEKTVRETIRTQCGLVPHQRTHLVRASLGTHTGLAGGAAAWLHRYPGL